MTSPATHLALALSLTSSTTLALGLFVLFYKRESPVGRTFFLYCLSIAWWSFFQIFHHFIADKNLSLLAARLMTAGGSFLIPSLFVDFVHRLLGIRERRWLLAVCYALSFAFACLSMTPHMIADTEPKFYLKNLLTPGPLYSYAVLFFLSCIAYGHYHLYRAYTGASGSRRNQLAYLLWSSTFGYFGGGANFLLVFGLNIPLLNPFGTYAIPLYVAATTYAIVKHRLLDIRIVVNKWLAYALLLGLVMVPVYIIAIISHRATLYSLPPLFASTLVFACGLWVLLENPKATTNITFGLLCLAVCTWLSGVFLMYSASQEREALLWGRFVYVGVAFIPALFYHFHRSFLKDPPARRSVLANYLVSSAFLVLIPTPYFLSGHYRYFWGYYPQAGVLHPLFLLYFGLVSGLSLYKLHQGYTLKQANAPLDARRVKYVFGAFAIGYLASIDFVQSYGLEFYPFGWVFASLWPLIVTYAIVKHRVMDVTLITSKPRIMPLAQALALIPFYVMILLLLRLYTGAMQFVLAGILVAVFSVFAGLLVNLRRRMEKAVEKTLFKTRYDAYETLIEFSRAMVSILDLKTLYQEITSTLAKVMGIQKVSLFILDNERGSYSLRAFHGVSDDRLRMLQLKSHDQFVRALRELDQPILKEELEHGLGLPQLRERQVLVDTLTALESELCVPLINKERLIGFLNLGYKADHNMYSQDDLNLLFTLGHNAAIALDNAMLYEDLRRSQTLVRRTDRLRSLETIAGGFAHEIRNPLTSIKTFVQLAPERRNDLEFMEHFSGVVSEDVERIERLIQEILDYARYMEPKFTEEDLNDVVASCLYFVEVKADSQAVTIAKDLASDLPLVRLDRQQIRQVLLNLFLNAMEAMPDSGGRLTVKTHRLTKASGDSWVQIEVADTGRGIQPENLEQIFDPFYTTKHESGEREGTGLGLSIVHQIVQEHRGNVEVQSAVGKGTTFLVNLPVNPVPGKLRKEHEQYEETGLAGR
ncbi:MAG: ATP-binding protein [Nitrospirota bacterium]